MWDLSHLGALSMLPPPCKELLESNTQSIPGCVLGGCIHVKAVPANLWQATGPWDLGTDIP